MPYSARIYNIRLRRVLLIAKGIIDNLRRIASQHSECCFKSLMRTSKLQLELFSDIYTFISEQRNF